MIRSLIRDLVDYAGLFPPAGLSMQAATANYAAYREGPHSFALSRFVVPTARLEELEASLPADIEYAWRISALLTGSLETDLAAIEGFNHRQMGRAFIDTVELKCQTADQIEAAAKKLPEDLAAYFEIPVAEDPMPLVGAIAEVRLRAKIRTGGTTPDAFPPAWQVIRFIERCERANVAFKATAGLHHPLYSCRALTYAPDAPQGWMFGFLNVFLAAPWIRLGLDPKAVAPLLEVGDASALRFGPGEVVWGPFRLTGAQVEEIRTRFAISFGSCSFEEPIAELQSLGLLEDASW